MHLANTWMLDRMETFIRGAPQYPNNWSKSTEGWHYVKENNNGIDMERTGRMWKIMSILVDEACADHENKKKMTFAEMKIEHYRQLQTREGQTALHTEILEHTAWKTITKSTTRRVIKLGNGLRVNIGLKSQLMITEMHGKKRLMETENMNFT